MEKMNPTVKKLWVDALRSGEYIQTTNNLRAGSCFCVLGVLCDLYHKHVGGSKWVQTGAYTYSFMVGSNTTPTTLPRAVQEWAGFKCSLPQFGPCNDNASPSSMNDNGATFEEIANEIEKLW